MNEQEWARFCDERHQQVNIRFLEGEKRMDELKKDVVIANENINKILFTGITTLIAAVTTLAVILLKG